LEVLGYCRIGNLKPLFERLFEELRIIPINRIIIDAAIVIRQQKSMSLGDSIIGATALENDLTIVTRNDKDFKWIEKLQVNNPFGN